MSPPADKINLAQASRLLTITAIVLALLYVGRPLFVPLAFGLLFAVICYPLCRWLELHRWPRTVAAAVTITLLLLLIAALGALLFYELSLLAASRPAIAGRIQEYQHDISEWLSSTVGINVPRQSDLFPMLNSSFGNNVFSSLTGVISSTASALVSVTLVLIFGVLFLLHRSTFLRVTETLAGEKYGPEVRPVLQSCIHTYFSFVKGTFLVYCIVGVLNSLGLFLLGIEHALLFGMIAAFMTIIPYVGILISAALPLSIALVTKDSWWYGAGVVFVFSFVQYLEANIIFPQVVGRKMNVSTWAMLVAIISGTLLWGIAGMMLFVPLTCMLKILTDQIPGLKALNMLLSRADEAESSQPKVPPAGL